MPARRGFACISPERRREIASKGGKKAHARGTAHRWTPEEARAAGKKGGALISQDTARMAELGRKGGKAKRKPRTVGGHDVGIDREVAAARREVETAQAESRLRGETIDALRKEVAGWEERTKHLGSVVLRAWEVLRKWWQWSKLEDRDEPFADALARAIAEDASHDAYALSEMRRLNEDLAASRAALEDVLWQEAHPNVEVVSRRRAEDDEKLWVAYDRSGNVNDTEWFAIAEGDTWKEALRNARRALAQEAGDATR